MLKIYIAPIRFTVGLLLISFLFTTSVLAQEIEKKGFFTIGAEGGPQITNIEGFSGYQATSKVGYTVGLFGEYHLSNDFKIRLGAYFDNRKFGLELYQPYLGNDIGDSIYVTNRSWYYYQVDYGLNYLTLPLGIVYTKGNAKFKILLQLNFYYSLFLSGNRSGADNYYFDPEDIQYFSNIGYYEGQYFTGGANITEYEGAAKGTSFNQDKIEYPYSNYDLGLNFLIGGVYNVTERIGISASVGFSLSFANLFQDSRLESKWRQATKFNFGIVYLLNKKNQKFGEN